MAISEFERIINQLTGQIKDLNNDAHEYLTTHNCLKCGKTLLKCKCKNPEPNEELNWEEYCESCGELLEDCECDNKELSRQDIGQEDEEMDDLEFDEMNDVWDEMDAEDEMEEDDDFF